MLLAEEEHPDVLQRYEELPYLNDIKMKLADQHGHGALETIAKAFIKLHRFCQEITK